MTCYRHNLRMIGLVLRGRAGTPEHAALLADVRRCRRCHRSQQTLPVHSYVRIPRARVELVDERLRVRG
ncbi:hypothetical protein [Nocardioides aquiterrae]|uniref:Uncharacterized protein n=1 Tax=Nocardioides aquiterrae TaxID=203799 RepID=A0ABP4EY10_9ACTN